MSGWLATLFDLIESIFLRHECMRCKIASLHARPVAAKRSVVPLDADVHRLHVPRPGFLQRRRERHNRVTPGARQVGNFPNASPRIDHEKKVAPFEEG